MLQILMYKGVQFTVQPIGLVPEEVDKKKKKKYERNTFLQQIFYNLHNKE